MADVRADDLTDAIYKSFYLVSYGNGTAVTPQDGAAGLFTLKTGACSTTMDNDGSILVNIHTLLSPICYVRQNVNGDLRQWGLTKGSSYDVLTHSTGASDAALELNSKIIPAFISLGIPTIHTGGVSLQFQSMLAMRNSMGFTCDTPPVNGAANADYTNLPGSIVMAHGSRPGTVFIDTSSSNDSEIYNCAAIVPAWYLSPSLATWPCPWNVFGPQCGIDAAAGLVSPAA